ncbi:ANTAR domain-containing response regulator [Chitinimonas koreensis]|uniref:ANTAR domain-containing response regulator n=1 Tax=Chitinimonas koreensis TaxID=356302 RepID=UPI0004084CBB|nr:ANTAR domain-containing protein [Chitinimonas koreensis]
MGKPLRLVLVNDTERTVGALRDALLAAGFEVLAEVASAFELAEVVARLQPDAVIVDTDSPSRDVLEHIAVMHQDAPRPIVMFTGDGDEAHIRAAVRAGVTAYVVDGLTPARLKPVLDVAIARFDEERRLRDELADTRRQLADRKLIDRAKGLVMKRRGLGEDEAYQLLRRTAMARGVKLAEVARQLVEASELLG